MKKINFVNKPNTDTPINDKNLNKMQENIENAIDSKVTKGTVYANGQEVSINQLNTDGKWRVYIAQNGADHNYLGFYGNVIVETFVQSEGNGCIQRITKMNDGKTFIRYATNSSSFSYDNVLYGLATKQDEIKTMLVQKVVSVSANTRTTVKVSYSSVPGTLIGALFIGTICTSNNNKITLVSPNVASADVNNSNATVCNEVQLISSVAQDVIVHFLAFYK